MAFPLSVSRSRFYQFWLRLWYVSARTPKFKPLLRAEFANGDMLAQADFLFRAGYYNAAVCMTRFAFEKRLTRLALITPRWKEFRCKPTSGIAHFLYASEVIDCKTKRRFNNFYTKASKYAHSTIVEKFAAAKIIAEAESLMPVLDAATCQVLGK